MIVANMPKLHADIRKYYIYRALLKRFALPVLVIFALDRGVTLEQLALIGAVTTALGFILEIPSGVFADIIGHKRALVISMIGQAASMALYFGGTYEWIFAASVAYFAFVSLMTGTSEAIFYERVKSLGLEKEHGKLYGRGKGFATAVSVVSMISAGVLYGIAWYLPFAVGILQFLIAAVIIGSFGKIEKEVSVEKREGLLSFFAHVREGVSAVQRSPQAFWMIIASALVIGPLFALGDFQQAIMQDLGMSAAVVGFIYAGKRALSVVLQGTAHIVAKRLGPPRMVLVSAALMVMHLLAVAIIDDPILIIAPLLVGSLAWVGLEVARNDFLNTSLQTTSRATALSVSNLIQTLTMFIVVVAFGQLAERSAQFAYGVIGIALVLLLIPVMIKLYGAYQAK